MPGTAGPRIGMVWGYSPGETGWGVGGFNPNFARLEALVSLAVLEITSTPPGSPSNGDCYIVGSSPSGAWSGHADDVAVYYTSGGWVFIDPAIGLRAFNRDDEQYYRWDGADWIVEGFASADVSGPASSTDENIAVFDGTTGKIIKDGGKALPSGLLVGDTDTQILTNKVIDGADNSLVVYLDTDVTGNLDVSHLNGGSGASNTTAWFGDGTWKPVATGGGGASVTISDTPPGSPEVGDLWFDSGDTITLYVWYDDGTSSQWIPACNCGGGGGDFLALSGGSMEGPLVLEDGSEAVSDAYCDEYLVHLTGATMTGPLILAGDPVDPLGAATKQFVESLGYITTITLSGDISGSGSTTINTTLATVPISKGGSGQTAIPAAFNALAASGGTVGGTLTVNGNITASGVAAVGASLPSSPDTGNLFVAGPISQLISSPGITHNAYASGATWKYVASDYATSLTMQGGVFRFYTAPSGTAGGTPAFTQRALVDNNGLTVTGNISGNAIGGSPLQITVPSGQDNWIYLIGTRQWKFGQQLSGDWWLYDYTASRQCIIVTSTGACSASSTWGVTSDTRLKENIQDYPRGLQEILALNPIYYQWNGKGGVPADGEIHFGLAAQDVEEVLPELIREHEYVPPEGSDDEPMIVKTYSPTDITFALVNAIKELQKQIEELKAALPPGVRP